MTTLGDVAALARAEQGLAVVSTLRADLSIQSSLVNVGVMAHPLTGKAVVAFVTYGKVKLANLRTRPQLTIDATMVDQRRAAVLVEPSRIYSN